MTRFVVALRAEATPLIQHYRMLPEEDSGRAFPIYRSQRQTLVIAGVGKIRAAAATAVLASKLPSNASDAWINIGIAGHRDRPLGELVVAHTVTDHASGKRYFPPRLGAFDLTSTAIRTVDRPETEFEADDVYEMEASGFVETALRFATGELVQCLKIVSDNRSSGTATITRESIHDLVVEHLGAVDALSNHLEQMVKEAPATRLVDASVAEVIVGARHFTTSQKRRLATLLLRLQAFDPTPDTSGCDQKSAAELLQCLENRVHELALKQQGYA